MKRNRCALIIVEGQKTEPSIFKYIFEKYGYHFHDMNNDDDWDSYKIDVDNRKTIFLIQGKRNRLKDLLEQYEEYDTLSECYKIDDVVALNYIVYDFDYVKSEELQKLRKKFYSPQEGELLLSNPCIEVLAEQKFYPHKGRSTRYKKRINSQIEETGFTGKSGIALNISYICSHFEELLITHIKRNCIMFNERNVLKHPSLLIDYVLKTNKNNVNTDLFEFHYLSTVIYVAIAELEGLTKKVDNADEVISYFKKKQRI